MPAEHLHEPWRSFLHDIDTQLSGPTEVHCLGGFVVAEYYELARPTSDVDIIQVRGASDVADLKRIAGKGSLLAKKHRIHVDSDGSLTFPSGTRSDWSMSTPASFRT